MDWRRIPSAFPDSNIFLEDYANQVASLMLSSLWFKTFDTVEAETPHNFASS
jgi:hypothetical protein